MEKKKEINKYLKYFYFFFKNLVIKALIQRAVCISERTKTLKRVIKSLFIYIYINWEVVKFNFQIAFCVILKRHTFFFSF